MNKDPAEVVQLLQWLYAHPRGKWVDVPRRLIDFGWCIVKDKNYCEECTGDGYVPRPSESGLILLRANGELKSEDPSELLGLLNLLDGELFSEWEARFHRPKWQKVLDARSGPDEVLLRRKRNRQVLSTTHFEEDDRALASIRDIEEIELGGVLRAALRMSPAPVELVKVYNMLSGKIEPNYVALTAAGKLVLEKQLPPNEDLPPVPPEDPRDPRLTKLLEVLTDNQQRIMRYLWNSESKTVSFDELREIPKAWQGVPSEDAIDKALKRIRTDLVNSNLAHFVTIVIHLGDRDLDFTRH